MPTVLVVEDDPTIGFSLQFALGAADYQVSWEKTGFAAIEHARTTQPDLVLLDLGLLDVDGLTVCRELRMLLPMSVIVVLTARREQIDIVSGLESGADDYLIKPFSLVEILARVRAHLRRSGKADSDTGEQIVIGALTIDESARRATLGGDEIMLRAREFDLLLRLARHPGAAVSRETLMAEVWDTNWFGSTKTLDVHVASLRRRLREVSNAQGPAISAPTPDITTLRGHGYRLDAGQPI